jgi:hypothetical protein
LPSQWYSVTAEQNRLRHGSIVTEKLDWPKEPFKVLALNSCTEVLGTINEFLPRKHKALSSNPGIAKIKQKMMNTTYILLVYEEY